MRPTNKLYDLIAEMETDQVYSDEQVEQLVNRYLDGADRDQLDPVLDACAALYKQLETDRQIKFKSAAKGFVRTYGFLSAILPYGNPSGKKLSNLPEHADSKAAPLRRRTTLPRAFWRPLIWTVIALRSGKPFH